MIAMPVSEEQRLTVVGAPSYFERHPPPARPHDLARHVCINWKPSAGGAPKRWEFTENRRDVSVTVGARVVTTDAGLNVRLAMAGVGLTISYDRRVRPHIEAGELVAVLEECCEPFPGFYLYFPRRRHRSEALQALIDHVRGQVPAPADARGADRHGRGTGMPDSARAKVSG